MSYLGVPGAKLYYEMSGTGPVLLLISGGTDDADDFEGVVPLLQDAFTVVAYDCRGLSRSRLDGDPADVPVEVHADDARRLLRAVGDRPAHVFGSSSGGQVALSLTARHPELVRGVVAHEPPAVALLPHGDPRRTVLAEARAVHAREGVRAGMAAFVAAAGLDRVKHPERHAPESPQAALNTQKRLVRMERNLEYFLSHIVGPAADFVPDVDALSSAPAPLTVAVGDASEGQLAHATGRALAARLGREPAVFPGGHAGFVTHPRAFARALRAVLAGRPGAD
ncbi:alpha/beta hydrolase [Streptomyces spinosirectus]|jgi:pimeloyl-ACP methyl ester carboxylesterase|uniref:alpha/beta fold hydrolase n=1 Tax=Streptomyces TaxID=1883 RepID=UPI000FFE829A|nr:MULTISPECIES: alpha/beta hydrolase [Streptomyces]MBY8338873.1 alpha/beta hydrolase [Streptomyces plumbidurans]UIR20975.1 alpha/beta hydrolase [Streptomyces spinosirectus]